MAASPSGARNTHQPGWLGNTRKTVSGATPGRPGISLAPAGTWITQAGIGHKSLPRAHRDIRSWSPWRRSACFPTAWSKKLLPFVCWFYPLSRLSGLNPEALVRPYISTPNRKIKALLSVRLSGSVVQVPIRYHLLEWSFRSLRARLLIRPTRADEQTCAHCA
jgi:hypothetical protein